MDDLTALNGALHSCAFVPVWRVWVELAERDDDRVRLAVTAAVGLDYGPYQGVAFESGPGLQFFRPLQGSRLGDIAETVEMPVRVLAFALAGDTGKLAAAIEAIRDAHSYEEPVIIVQQAWASRARIGTDRDNPNRWWNRGFAV